MVELHAFSNSSGTTYATAVNAVPTTNLIMAKVKVAPMKDLTVPRLELMGALLSSRFIRFLTSTYVLRDAKNQ